MAKHDLNRFDEIKDKDRIYDVWFMKKLCDASRAGKLEIYTSTLAIAECLHAGSGCIDEQAKSIFEAFMLSGEVVVPVGADVFVCQDARDLCWKHNVILSGADGIHVATAIGTECSEFITTDKRIQKINQKLLSAYPKLASLGLKVIKASETQCLPPEYRQEKLNLQPVKTDDLLPLKGDDDEQARKENKQSSAEDGSSVRDSSEDSTEHLPEEEVPSPGPQPT